MMPQALELIRGDWKPFTIAPSEDVTAATSLIFTAKRNRTDPDSGAVFQHALGAGVTVDESGKITVVIVHDDTKNLATCTLVWDVQAQWAIGNNPRTVGEGTLAIVADITRELDTSIPIHTTGPSATESAIAAADRAGEAADAAALARQAAEAARDLSAQNLAAAQAAQGDAAASKTAAQAAQAAAEQAFAAANQALLFAQAAQASAEQAAGNALAQAAAAQASASASAASAAAALASQNAATASQISAAASEGNALLYRNQAQAASAIATGQVLPLVATRAVADCLISDGATTNRCVYWPLGAAGAVAGKAIALPFEVDVPLTNPSANVTLVALCGALTTSPYDQNNACSVVLGTSGNLAIRQSGASYLADRRELSYAGFRAAYSGAKSLCGVVVFPAGDSATAPVVYLQGVNSSASFALSTAGTPPNWMPNTLVPTYCVSGYNLPAWRFAPHPLIIGALTAAEVLEWTQTGRLPTWCEVAAGSLLTQSGAWVNGSSTNFQYDSFSAIGLSGFTASCSAKIPYCGVYLDRTYSAGTRFRVRLNLARNSGDAGNSIRLSLRGDPSVSIAGESYFLATGDNDLIFTLSSGSTAAITMHGVGSAAYSVTVTATAISTLGPLYRPVIQPCQVLDDAGANGIAGVLTSGILPVTRRKDWRIRASVAVDSTGNKQLLGSALFADPQYHAIGTVDLEGAGTETASLGDGATATRYTASSVKTAGRSRETIANPFPADAAKTGIYYNVTAAATAGATRTLTLRGHRTD